MPQTCSFQEDRNWNIKGEGCLDLEEQVLEQLGGEKKKVLIKITAVEQNQKVSTHYFDTSLYSSVIMTLGKLVEIIIK